MRTDYCHGCKSWHRMSEFCNDDGRTEPRLIMTVSLSDNAAQEPSHD